MNTKLRRYHIDIYCPKWSRESVLQFINIFSYTKLKYSYHAKIKLKNMKNKYRIAIRNLVKNLDISNELYLDYVFEFYTNDKNVVKKVCYRFPMPDLDSDIILVIGYTGNIITIYLNDNFDKHHSLDINRYEKGEIVNEGKVDIENT